MGRVPRALPWADGLLRLWRERSRYIAREILSKRKPHQIAYVEIRVVLRAQLKSATFSFCGRATVLALDFPCKATRKSRAITVSDLTHLLQRLDQGDPKAAEELLPLVYDQLRKLAARQMAHQPPGHTLQPTALVHEAWLKLASAEPQLWNNRKHFFSTAAEAMRQILIDRARKKKAQRHGGGQEHVDMEAVEIASPAPDEHLLDLDDALKQFTAAQPAKAEVVKLKFFVGLKDREVAELLGITERTVQRHWAYAQVWLFDAMRPRAQGRRT